MIKIFDNYKFINYIEKQYILTMEKINEWYDKRNVICNDLRDELYCLSTIHCKICECEYNNNYYVITFENENNELWVDFLMIYESGKIEQYIDNEFHVINFKSWDNEIEKLISEKIFLYPKQYENLKNGGITK